MRYSLLSSVISTEGTQSATVIASRRPSPIVGNPPKRRLNRWPISSSSLNGSDRFHRTKPAIDEFSFLTILRTNGRVVLHVEWQREPIGCPLLSYFSVG